MSNYKKILLVILCTMRTSILNAEDVELKDVSPTKSIAAHVQLKLNECKTKLDLATNSLKASTPDLQDVAKKLTEVTNILCKDISLEIIGQLQQKKGDLEAKRTQLQKEYDEITKKIKKQTSDTIETTLKTQVDTAQKDNENAQTTLIDFVVTYKTNLNSVMESITKYPQALPLVIRAIKEKLPDRDTSDYATLAAKAPDLSQKSSKKLFDEKVFQTLSEFYSVAAALVTQKFYNISTPTNNNLEEYENMLKELNWPTLTGTPGTDAKKNKEIINDYSKAINALEEKINAAPNPKDFIKS